MSKSGIRKFDWTENGKTVIKDVKAKILNNISGNGQDQEVTINWDNGKGSTTFSSAFVNYMLDSTIEKGRTMGYPYIVSVKNNWFRDLVSKSSIAKSAIESTFPFPSFHHSSEIILSTGSVVS